MTQDNGGEVEETKEERMKRELIVEKQFILDSAPDNWEDEIDHAQLPEFEKDIKNWDMAEILSFSKNNYIWDDITYAKALLNVISEKIKAGE